MPDTAPGWYVDPDEPSLSRYWDGQLWTSQTAPVRQPPPPASEVLDPVPAKSKSRKRTHSRPVNSAKALRMASRASRRPVATRPSGKPVRPTSYRQSSRRPVKGAPVAPPISSTAVAAFIVVFFIPFVGWILGVVARQDIDRSGGWKGGRGLATASIWLGAIFTVIWLVAIFAIVVGVLSATPQYG
jgi:Protein of unknown function (DUF2510)/Domain of unknown function (DUF4190)